MNRAKFSLVKFFSVAILSGASMLAFANDAGSAAKAVKADPAKGATLYANGDATRGIVACASCHGEGGNSTISANPKLSAQHQAYLVKQLQEFTGPTRANPTMLAFAKALTPEDVLNISAYLSTQKPKQGVAKNKDIVNLGQKIYRGGIADKKVAACAGCHGPNGSGIPAQFPRLAGQHQDYTIAQLTNFRTGARKNSAQMTEISKKMSDDEMKAVADYIAGLK